MSRSNKHGHFILSKMFGCLMLFAILINSSAVNAQQQTKIILQHGSHQHAKRMDTAMLQWRAYGLGQFIHWGLYSILEGKWDGIKYNGAAEWIRSWKVLPNSVYDSLNLQFNPIAFHPDQWAAMAKQMGVKYLTITTKHHDGFCLWPSAFTDFTVAHSPFQEDVIKPVVEAYNKAGIDVYLYYSIMDWHNLDWRYDLKTKEDSIAFDRFKQFTKSQLTELVNRYPSIKGFWFDGTWDESWKKSGAFSDSLEQYLKTIHPGLIIGSRLRADEKGARHFDSNNELMGDYEQGWERKLPVTYADVHGNDWECVMTIPENGWGYAENWMGHWKSSYELIEMMVRSVSLGGNFVVNFGPKANGEFRNEEIIDAREMGEWMQQNKEAIYNCEYAGWDKQDWGYITKKRNENKFYLIVFNMPLSGKLKIKTDKLSLIEKAYPIALPQNQFLVEPMDNGNFYIDISSIKSKSPFVIAVVTKNAKGITVEDKKTLQ